MLTHEWSFSLLVTQKLHCGLVMVVNIKGIKSCLECVVGCVCERASREELRGESVSCVGKLCQVGAQLERNSSGRGKLVDVHGPGWTSLNWAAAVLPVSIRVQVPWALSLDLHQQTLQEAPWPSVFNCIIRLFCSGIPTFWHWVVPGLPGFPAYKQPL